MVRDRRALIVGLDTYQLAGNDLGSAVADAEAVGALLERHANGDPNYHCRLFLDRTDTGEPVSRGALRDALQELFDPGYKGDVLFYFSGHGVLSPTGGLLTTQDAEPNDWGVAMQEVVDLANASSACSIVLILDCCHAGDLGNAPILKRRNGDPLAALREDMTVIAASSASQPSLEAGGHGLFTAAVLDALEGGAADHMGWVTAPSIYAYVERRFGAWEQRPIYKSHATHVPVVRECEPLIDRLKLREMTKYFPERDAKLQLDPEYEPEDEHGNVHEPVNEDKVAAAQLFKEYRDAGLLKPSTRGEQLFWTARRSHTVELTRRGQEYWWLVAKKKL